MNASGSPGLVIVDEAGRVTGQNEAAERLLGHVVGRPCWDAVGALEDAEGLCCKAGCVTAMLAGGLAVTRYTRFEVGSRSFDLRCIPGGQGAVSVMTPAHHRVSQQVASVTPRELEVLRFLSEGDTTRSIAVKLGISASTVRTHVEHLRVKLRVTTRAALVTAGFRLGLLS